MSALYFRSRLLLFAFIFAAVCGCSSNHTLALARKDLPSLGPITVVRYETPGIVKSSGTETGILALVTIGAPGGSALLFIGDAYGRARGAETQTIIPDFGSVVMDTFIERLGISMPDWPEMKVIREPLKETFSEKTMVIELDVARLAYGSIDLTRGGRIGPWTGQGDHRRWFSLEDRSYYEGP